MRPIPVNANKIYDLTFYDAKIEKAYEIFSKISDPFDKLLSRITISLFDFVFGDKKRIKYHINQLEGQLNVFSDELSNFIVNYNYFLCKAFLNIGFLIPIENYTQGKIYYEKAFEIFNESEDFLKTSNDWIYYYLLVINLFMKSMVPKNLYDKISILQKTIETTKYFSIDGKQVAWYFCAVLGFVYANIGKFKEAWEMFNVEPIKTNYLILTLSYQEKARLSYIEGNLSFAIDLAQIGLEIDIESGFNWGISLLKSALAFYFAEKGEHEKAKQFLIELIPIKKAISNPFSTMLGYYNLIRFLTNSFQITNNPDDFTEAKKFLLEAEKFSNLHLENINVKNYFKISHAIILKFGRFYEKAQAFTIFKEMAENYSHNLISVQLKLDLIELMIEEAKASSTNQEILSEIIHELDDLITQIAKISILFTPKGAILKYTQHQILVSRYYFYIKGQTKEALETLEKNLKEVEKYNLPKLQKKIEIEIEKMNSQVRIWGDQSIQERLKKLEIEDYFKQALQIQEISKSSET